MIFNGGAESELAEWAAATEWGDIPPSTQRFVREFFMDSLGSALAGVAIGEVDAVRGAAGQLAGAGPCSVIGGRTASLYGATMVGAYLVTAATVCDVHRETQCHVGPSVVPAALATAEFMDRTDEETLAAVAVGLEVATRVAMSLKPKVSRERGWHAPGVAGPFGAAAAVARLLGVGVGEMITALSLASSQASGTYSQWATPGVKFHQTHGALAGLLAAELAAQGLRASHTFLQNADGGFLRVYSDGGDVTQLVADLGQRFELERISLRRWPGGTYVQSLVTGLFELLAQSDVGAPTVRRLAITMSPAAFSMHGQQGWGEPFTARLSARYIGAVVLLDRACWLAQFTGERIAEADVNRLAEQVVQVSADPSLEDAAIRLEVELEGGRRLGVDVAEPYGAPARRLTAAHLEEKFMVSGTPVLGADRTVAALSLLQGTSGWRATQVGTALRSEAGGEA